MKFDRWTAVLLCRSESAPRLDDAASAALQDAHLAFFAKEHSDGRLLAAGPARGESRAKVAGICIYAAGVEEALAIAQEDPAVQAGEFRLEALDWTVPAGTIRFLESRFPRSMQDVRSS